jgi:hypothetical protein
MFLTPDWFNKDNFYSCNNIEGYIIGPITVRHIMKRHPSIYLPFIANNKKVFICL